MPKPPSGKILIKEIRITPYEQKPIQLDESDLHRFSKLILCEEGTPNGNPQLHYHGYVETDLSMTSLRLILKKWAQEPSGNKINGNKLYFTKDPHEYTMGYIIKQNKIHFQKGFTQTTLDTYVEQSRNYQRKVVNEKKSKQRRRDNELSDIYETVRTDLESGLVSQDPTQVIRHFLDICYEKEVRFPTRSQMEGFVIKLLYPHYPGLAVHYYGKIFSQ